MKLIPNDLRFALRSLRRQPTFTLIALLTLALGIGANTAIFSVIKAVLLDPLPYDAPEEIVVLWEVNPDGSLEQVSVPTFLDWQEQARSLDSVAAYRRVDYAFAGSAEPLNVAGVTATPGLFRVLHSSAILGRTFTADEAIPGGDRVVVLGHGFWQRNLGGDEGIVGTAIELDANPYTVIGVMPDGFEFPTSEDVDFWTPLAFDPNDAHGRSRRARSLLVVGRMANDTTPISAQEEMSLLASRIAMEHANTNEGWGVRVVAARDQLVNASRPALLVLMGAVGFMLLIVCANLANLLLARLSSRRQELAVRGALGAGRWALARLSLAESLILAVFGGALGLAVAFGGLRLIAALPEGQLPRMDQVQIDSGVLVFTSLVSFGVALLFGVLPAFYASRSQAGGDLADSTRATGGSASRRTIGALVVAEVALALVLLVGAGLMVRSFSRLLQVQPGFDSSHLISAQVFLPRTAYPERPQIWQFFEEVIARLEIVPGIESASAVSALPMRAVGITFALPFSVEGQAPPESEDPRADVRMVAPGYFETMRIALVSGRFLDERDVESAQHTSVINATMAERYFPDSDPVGQFIENPHGRSAIVGVVADVRHQSLDSEPRKQVYLSLRQSTVAGMAVVARTERDPAGMAGDVQRAIWSVDPSQPIYDLSTMDQLLTRVVFLPRLSTQLLGIFALASLLLAALGIYGVLSYSVSQRSREIGLRMALGSEARSTIALVMRGSLALVLTGVGLGLVAAIFMARWMTGVLYGVGPFDLPSFVGASLVLLGAGVAASLVPALRATRVDPMVVLHDS